jgi:AraC-like DNA-binding protein
MFRKRPIPYLARGDDRFLLFEEMYRNLTMGYNTENMEYVSFCLLYFLASIKYLNQYREINNVKSTDTVQKSILYMRDNLENKITLQNIAGHVGYSVSRFSSLFISKTLYSPMDYYLQLKVQRACSYLQFSDLTIKEISFRLGYYDPFHFSKAFKQEMGVTPKEYRKLNKDVGRR